MGRLAFFICPEKNEKERTQAEGVLLKVESIKAVAKIFTAWVVALLLVAIGPAFFMACCYKCVSVLTGEKKKRPVTMSERKEQQKESTRFCVGEDENSSCVNMRYSE